MTTLFLVLQVVFAVIITISVLLQKSSSIGLGAYSGSNESLFGAKGPAGFLAKFTAFMGILFVINTLVLAYFYQQDAKTSVVDRVKIEANATKSVPNAVPGVPSIPAPGAKSNFAPTSTEANPVNSSEANSTAPKIEAPVLLRPILPHLPNRKHQAPQAIPMQALFLQIKTQPNKL